MRRFTIMSRTLSYLWCILVVCTSHTYIGYGALTDPRLSSNLSKDRHLQSSDAGHFNLDPLHETSVENWSSKPGGKRDDSIVRVSRRTKGDDGEAICRKKSNGGVKWSCKTIASCQYAGKLLSVNHQTVCGGEGSSQKICCPCRINPVKVAQEKCLEYHSSRYRRAIHGDFAKLAVIGEFPHMVNLGEKEDPPTSSNPEWHCGGTLISPQYFLTAAHCNNPENSIIKLNLGVLGNTSKPSSTSSGNVYRIVERINHPEYNSKQFDNDIALLKLDRLVEFSSAIRPVCLALPPNAKYNASEAIVTGWGAVEAGGIHSEKLLWVSISLLNNSECVKAFENETRLSKGFDAKSMICAGRERPSDGSTCEGDSGGPLQFPIVSPKYKGIMWLQAGITSFGASYCEEQPEVYTRISNFLPWIQSIVWPTEDLI